MRHGIRLVAHEHAPARRAVAFGVLFAILKRITNNPLDALARVDVFLKRNLIGRTLLEDSARIGIDAFRVFADHDEIHILRFHAF